MLNDDSEDMLFGMFEGISSDIFKNQIKNAARALWLKVVVTPLK